MLYHALSSTSKQIHQKHNMHKEGSTSDIVTYYAIYVHCTFVDTYRLPYFTRSEK